MVALLTVAEVAERLRMSERFVRDEISRGNLRGAKVGRRWRIPETALDAYIAANMNVAVQDRPRRRRRLI